jgi:hypothetical protein
VEQQITASPDNDQQQRNFEERLEFHVLPPQSGWWHGQTNPCRMNNPSLL